MHIKATKQVQRGNLRRQKLKDMMVKFWWDFAEKTSLNPSRHNGVINNTVLRLR
jgi:hypothetical protein